jgi:hypothetical protein
MLNKYCLADDEVTIKDININRSKEDILFDKNIADKYGLDMKEEYLYKIFLIQTKDGVVYLKCINQLTNDEYKLNIDPIYKKIISTNIIDKEILENLSNKIYEAYNKTSKIPKELIVNWVLK